jgi:hypothetical protein
MIVQLIRPDPILLDDPVRPHIPPEQRVGHSKEVWLHIEDKRVDAVLCVHFCSGVPTSEQELWISSSLYTAVLYSVWSYQKGAGRKIVREFLDLYQPFGIVKRIVTLSPKTDMARDFHLRNGANLLQENETTVNYEY